MLNKTWSVYTIQHLYPYSTSVKLMKLAIASLQVRAPDNGGGFRALDKRECLVIIKDNFCYLCIKTYVVIH